MSIRNTERVQLFPVAVAVLACVLSWPRAAEAQGVRLRFELPDGETEQRRHETITLENLEFPRFLNPTNLYIDVHGKAPFLVEAAVGGPACSPALQFKEVGFDAVHPEYPLHRPTFSRVYMTDTDPGAMFGHRMGMPFEFTDGRRAITMADPDAVPSTYEGEWLRNVPADWKCEVGVRVSRTTACTMWAQVVGDVEQVAFGSTAYFNTFENGVPITTGTIADPGMHEDLQDFAAGMADLVRAVQEMGYETPGIENLEESGEELPDTDLAMEQMRDEMFGEGGDKFGLTLADVNSEAAAENLEGDALGQRAQGIGVLTGSFTLEASAAGDVDFIENPEQSIDLETGAGSIMTIPLSSLRVVPGGVDGALNRVPFMYTEGEEGSATLTVREAGNDVLMGQVFGELYTEGEYDGRKARIMVTATFIARRGFKSCMQ